MESHISKGCNTEALCLKETTPEGSKEFITEKTFEGHCEPLLYQRGGGEEVLMGKMQRDKGARFERIVASMFRDFGYNTFRTAQYEGKSGNCADVEGAPGIHIECKHCERMTLYDWMSQAVRDSEANKKGNKPVVIHKANNKDILVTMRFDDWIDLYREWEAGNGA